ncbi:MAG: type I-MYXAN CRISPR-associated protein Cas5/Cmx5/DevS [Pseudanabaenaceae cyanobacterium]
MSKLFPLLVEVPIACFRQSHAREYAETYPVPPPATVYGMLLSCVGEVNRYQHIGVKLAIAMLSSPTKSTVIRTFRRFKKREISDPTNARPDFQELLTDTRFIVCVDSSQEKNSPTLQERLENAFTHPETIDRFGGLCLGESRDLVNSIQRFTISTDEYYEWLTQDPDGLLTLPYWVDHVGSRGTKWQRYRLELSSLNPRVWTQIKTD